MLKNLLKLLNDEEGATAVEYGLIVAAIAAVIAAVVVVIGKKTNNALQTVSNQM